MVDMRSEKLDLSNDTHRKIAFDIYKKHSKWFVDDSVPDLESLINHVQYLLSTGDIGFVFYVNDKPYGLIFASFNRYNNASIEASTLGEHNLFTSYKILKYFIEYLFDVHKVGKIKAQTYVWNHNAELACKLIGFRKEGILREELFLEGKPVNLLSLSFTKSDYVKNGIAPINKDRLKKLIRIINNEQK